MYTIIKTGYLHQGAIFSRWYLFSHLDIPPNLHRLAQSPLAEAEPVSTVNAATSSHDIKIFIDKMLALQLSQLAQRASLRFSLL